MCVINFPLIFPFLFYLFFLYDSFRFMAALINPGCNSGSDQPFAAKKLVLLSKLEGFRDDVNQALIIPGSVDGVITASKDRTLRIWLRRSSGQYWPSVCQNMNSGVTCMYYYPDRRHLFVGSENGVIWEYTITDDFNQVTFLREVCPHQGKITAIFYALKSDWVISIGHDKVMQYYVCQTGKSINSYISNAWCTALAFDSATDHAFVGDYSGQIAMLKLDNIGIKVIKILKGHEGSIQTLKWDSASTVLYSGSYDQIVTAWDFGSQKGTMLKFEGHKNKVTSICYDMQKKLLISGGEDGLVIFWQMSAARKEPPAWIESDACQVCAHPFFWNFRGIFNQKQMGLRQHHCRGCGSAVCDKCSEKRSVIPIMGFESPVRVCETCYNHLQEADLTSMATFHDAKHSIVHMDLDESKKKLLTVGQDRIVKIWSAPTLL